MGEIFVHCQCEISGVEKSVKVELNECNGFSETDVKNNFNRNCFPPERGH